MIWPKIQSTVYDQKVSLNKSQEFLIETKEKFSFYSLCRGSLRVTFRNLKV